MILEPELDVKRIRTSRARFRAFNHCLRRGDFCKLQLPGDGTLFLGFPTLPPWRLSPGIFVVPFFGPIP